MKTGAATFNGNPDNLPIGAKKRVWRRKETGKVGILGAGQFR